MKVVVCIDDSKGMLFNKRRQSRDKVVLADVVKQAENAQTKKIWIHSFSEKLFSGYENQINVDDAFLEKAEHGEICFVENQRLALYEGKIEELIVYKWNRRYPGDFYLDLDFETWELQEQVEFAGNSHEKITREIYSGRV